jgi:hypothetical protein
MKRLISFCILSTFGVALAAASDSQDITTTRILQIPGAVLKPGAYTLSVEDRLNGRAIVRITKANSSEHYLLLAVPVANRDAETGIVLIPSDDTTKRIVRGWVCDGCNQELQLVYPKLEAAQITSETGQSVLAADPAYDKLPANLSSDDMKVVTLWLLSPERISEHRGVGLKAIKYVVASAAPEMTRLPETASSTYLFGGFGVLFLVGFVLVHIDHFRRSRCAA